MNVKIVQAGDYVLISVTEDKSEFFRNIVSAETTLTPDEARQLGSKLIAAADKAAKAKFK